MHNCLYAPFWDEDHIDFMEFAVLYLKQHL